MTMLEQALGVKKASPSIDDRVETRLPVQLTALVVNDDIKPEPIQILNIARLGFLAKSAQLRETGEVIVIQIEPIGRCEAHVVWADSNQFGGRFIQPIDIAALI
jgi:hypothetical protein